MARARLTDDPVYLIKERREPRRAPMSENELMGLRRRYGTQGRRFGKSVLSQPEVQVLRLAADGLRDKEIAAKLIKGEETVKAQISSILRRLEAHNRTHAVAIAIRAGLID